MTSQESATAFGTPSASAASKVKSTLGLVLLVALIVGTEVRATP
jgi:hypothetical protein